MTGATSVSTSPDRRFPVLPPDVSSTVGRSLPGGRVSCGEGEATGPVETGQRIRSAGQLAVARDERGTVELVAIERLRARNEA